MPTGITSNKEATILEMRKTVIQLNGLNVGQWLAAIKTHFGDEYYNDLIESLSEENSSQHWVYKLNEHHIYGSSRLGIVERNLLLAEEILHTDSVAYYSYMVDSIKYQYRGMKRYELSNHLGNILAVITDRRIQSCTNENVMYYQAKVVNIRDYDPFGMLINERTFSATAYRFAYGGMEKDDEIKGSGNSYTTEYRIYDSRLGRWLSIDPLADEMPSFSPYVYTYNNPIVFKDQKGDFGLIGAIISAAVEITGQMISNKIAGQPLSKIEWGDVVIAAASGFVGIPPMARMAKYGKTIHKTAKLIRNNWDDAAQAYLDENGIASHEAATKDFASSKITGLVINKSIIRFVKSAQIKAKIAKRIIDQTKKAVESSQASLDRTLAKKNYKNKAEAIERKQANLSKDKDELARAEVNATIVSTAAAPPIKETKELLETALQKPIGGTVVEVLQDVVSPSNTGYLYKPEQLGNTDFYYMTKDHTQVYNKNTGELFNMNNGKLGFEKKTAIDVSKPQVISSN
jgi:RHS repeat-associated protein